MSHRETSLQAESPTKELANISSYFDNHGRIWIDAYDAPPVAWHEYFPLQLREKYTCQLIAGEGTGTAVDLGCGPGHALIRMKQLGFERAIGVDISDKMLESAQELIRANHLEDSISTYKADVCELAMIDSNSVDVVTALGVIEYLSNDEALLAEIFRILKPQGAAVVQTRNGAWIHSRLRKAFGYKPKTKIWYQEHSPRRLRKLAENVGFRAEKDVFAHYYALYPFDLMPRIRKLVRPVDNFLSRNLERFSEWSCSRWFTSMYIAKLRKPNGTADA